MMGKMKEKEKKEEEERKEKSEKKDLHSFQMGLQRHPQGF